MDISTAYVVQYLTLVVLMGFVSGYSSGSPPATCITMFPKHGARLQTRDCPFIISTNQTEYLPGDVITVTVRSTTSELFKGIHIRGIPVYGDTEEIIGQFITWPENKTKAYNCFGGKQNMVTHSNSIPVLEVVLTWKAPDESVGDVDFVASFALDYETVWSDQSVRVFSSINVTRHPTEKVSATFDLIDWSMCGKGKGCFLYPQMCTGYDCYAAITYKTVNESIEFEMFGSQEGYISVGFSDDKEMDDDETVQCMVGDKGVAIHRGFNHELYNEKQMKAGLTNLEVQYVDGRLFCRFTRPMVMFTYKNIGHTDKRTFDLSKKHHLMLAWGLVYGGSDLMAMHKELPVITHSKVSFQDTSIVRGSSLSLTSQIHGTLLLVAWILLAGIVIMLPRNFRYGQCGKTCIGVKAWFQVHRAAALLVWTLTAAGFIIIFAVFRRIAETASPHAYIGIAVMAGCTLQVMAGVLRPRLESKFRRVFNLGHWLFGRLNHIAAAVTLFFAFDQEVIPAPQRMFGFIVLAVWLGYQLLWELVLELYKWCYTSKTETYSMSNKTDTGAAEQHQKSGDTFTSSGLLFMYVVGLVAIVAAALASVFLF